MSQEQTDDSHLLLIISEFGPLPEPFISQMPRFQIYFHPNGEQFDSKVDESETKLTCYNSLETHFQEKKSFGNQ